MAPAADAAARSAGQPRAALLPPEVALIEAIFARAGLQLADFRTAPLKRRLHAVLRAVRCDQPRAALAAVEQQPELADKALAALVIGHTLAFRDRQVFEHLREVVLPRLGKSPRVWSIGCSRGLELLSVALLLAERGIECPQLRGSDCRAVRPALDTNLVRDLMDSIPADFSGLERIATRSWIRRQIEAVEWRTENVLDAHEAFGCDLILCRNVSIYLEPDAARRLWQIVTDSLRPGGWLVTGKAEHLGHVAGLRRVAHCVYQRDEEAP